MSWTTSPSYSYFSPKVVGSNFQYTFIILFTLIHFLDILCNCLCTGGAGTSAGSATGSSGGTAEMIMSVQLFSALNYMKYMVSLVTIAHLHDLSCPYTDEKRNSYF